LHQQYETLPLGESSHKYTLAARLQYGYSRFALSFRSLRDKNAAVGASTWLPALARPDTETLDREPRKIMKAKIDIRQATASYETWLRGCTTVVEAALKTKHAQMKSDPFYFFRGTYYRWTQLFPEICKELAHAPKLLCAGDLHLGSFGTWRDAEGRLCWGVDDFDDAYRLPYANDLVRLAASVKMVTDSETLAIKYRDGCDAILDGYVRSLKKGGCPFVLAEKEKNMERLGIEAIKPSEDFWENLIAAPALPHRELPEGARIAIHKSLPPKIDYKVSRRQAGMGSLGQPRFVAVAEHEGGYIAREIKAAVPSAMVWKNGQTGSGERYYDRAIAHAVRSHDPYQRTVKGWVLRRLSPDSNPIELDGLPEERDEYTLLRAMGEEVANVHLGSKKQMGGVLKDLRGRENNWLRKAGKTMARALEKEWKEYR
jgi:Uncharacterized protein conserved in bacteria (DUF2252)